jgi:hypothetical protein
MADWYANYTGGSGASNISIHLVVNEGARTSTTVRVDFALYIERTVGVGFYAESGSGNTSSIVIDGETFSRSNYTYDFRSGSGTFRQFLINSGSKTISTTSPRTITVSAATNQGVNPPGTATIGGQSFTITPLPAFTDSTIVPIANVGFSYLDSVAATSTTGYSVFSGALPNGINLNTSTGVIAGTPTVGGNFNFIIRASNAFGNANTPALSINVFSGARVWNGTSFISGTNESWNGTQFVTSTTRVWNGSNWVSAR